MTKRIHPIRKMQKGLKRVWDMSLSTGYERGFENEAKVIARHVKPLLDALEEAHKHMNHRAGMGYEPCTMCDLLAAWREAPK